MNHDLQGFAEGMMRAALHNFREDGHLTPVVFVLTPNGVGVLAPEMMKIPFSDEGKDFFSTMVRMLAKDPHCLAILFIVESWIGDDPEALAWREKHGTLETYPNRKECIMAMLESRDAPHTQRLWRSEIKRVGERVYAEEFAEMPQPPGMQCSGRFVGWFQDHEAN